MGPAFLRKAVRQQAALVVLALAVAVTPAFAATRPATRRLLPSAPRLAALPVWQQEATLLPEGDPIGDRDERYGSAVAADGDTIAIGAPGHEGPTASGCVRIYVRAAGVWTQQALLTAPTADADGFGGHVALSGDTLAVGTDQYFGGSVYVYVRSGVAWSLEATITPGPGAVSFGEALALSGDTLAVGAPEASTGFGSSSGAAFVYVRVAGAWALEEQVLGFEIASDDRFGAAIALDGNALAVGAPGDDTGVAVGAGSVYLFTRAGGHWAQSLKLIDPAAAGSAQFGRAVALAGTSLVVGAPTDGIDGLVHIYENVSGFWIQRALLAPSSLEGRGFGTSVSLDAGQLLVGFGGFGASPAELWVESSGLWSAGATLTPPNLGSYNPYPNAIALASNTAVVGVPTHTDTGAAWVWAGSGATWTLEATLDNPGTARSDAFGSALAIDGQTLVVGAPNDDTVAGRDSGAAYVFEHTVAGWTLRQKLIPPAGWASSGFGSSVAVSGDRLVVGAPGTPSASYVGRVLAFTRAAGVWTQTAELAVAGSYARFGAAVGLNGAQLLVGAPDEDTSSAWDVGAVYAFEHVAGQWNQTQRLTRASEQSGARFGTALATSPSGLWAAIGAPGAASAEILSRAGGTWTRQRVVSTDQPSDTRSFGTALAMTDTLTFVGEPWARQGIGTGSVSTTGAVSVFDASGGVAQKLHPGQQASYSYFGSALAFDGAILAVGAPGSGAVHVFENVAGTWTKAAVLGTSAAGVEGNFGDSVAVAAGRLLVGQPGADAAAQDGGAVYGFAPSVADLGITLAAPASAPQGSLVTIGVSLTNSGPTAIAGAMFRLTFDAGLAPRDDASGFVGPASCSTSGAVVTCAVPSIVVGTTQVLQISRVATATGSSSILGQVLSSDADPANDSAGASVDVTPSTADASLSIFGPTYAQVGAWLTYSVRLSNAGPSAAAGLQVTLPTPPGLVFKYLSGCDPANCRVARLDVGQVTWIDLTYEVPAAYAGPAPIVFSGSVTTASQDPQPANNQDSFSSPFLPPSTPLDYYTVTPCRLYDSRAGGGPPVAGGSTLLRQAVNQCGIPWSARALALNVTVTGATAAGNLRVYPGYSPVPTTSTVNFTAGQTRANNAVVGLSPSGYLALFASTGTSVHVILDVAGYFQ